MKSSAARHVTLPLLLLLFLALALLIFLSIPTLGAGALSRNEPATLFPYLTKIRDSAIEFFFGPHPAKAASSRLPPREALASRYAGEIVLRFNLTTPHDEAALADAADRLFLDVWAVTDEFVDVRLHSDEVAPLLGLLPESLQSHHSTLIHDVAAAVYHSFSPSDDSDVPPSSGPSTTQLFRPAHPGDNLFFQDYQPLTVIIRWMRLLESMFPSLVEYVTVGKSFEGREIPALRVRAQNPPQGRSRKTIVVTGGSHAREWISTSTVNYVAWSYITSFGNEPMISRFLNHYEIVFIPVLNPDGVEYSWQVDRLWRKSRQSTRLRFCRGIDLDHAFGFEWDATTTQRDPCSEGYGGESPFQAVEALELAGWARNEKNNGTDIVGLLDLHSYSQQVLFPYSYTCAAEPPNLENLQELAAGLAKAIRLSNGESYSVTSACNGDVGAAIDDAQGVNVQPAAPRMGAGGGSAIDWFYHELGTRFSYQIKLRDTGSYGFLLPRKYIIPTGEETFNAMKYFGDYLMGNNGIEKDSKDSQHFSEFEKDDDDDDDDDDVVAQTEDEDDVARIQELRRRRLKR